MRVAKALEVYLAPKVQQWKLQVEQATARNFSGRAAAINASRGDIGVPDPALSGELRSTS